MADHRARTLGQIAQAVQEQGISIGQVVQAAMVLTGGNFMAAVQADITVNRTRKHTDKLNAWLMDKSRGSTDVSYLASPVIGGGVSVERFQQLFLLALSHGKKSPAEQAGFVWQILAAQGQKLLKEGKTLETSEENLAEPTAQAQTFVEKRLPVLRALQVVS